MPFVYFFLGFAVGIVTAALLAAAARGTRDEQKPLGTLKPRQWDGK